MVHQIVYFDPKEPIWDYSTSGGCVHEGDLLTHRDGHGIVNNSDLMLKVAAVSKHTPVKTIWRPGMEGDFEGLLRKLDSPDVPKLLRTASSNVGIAIAWGAGYTGYKNYGIKLILIGNPELWIVNSDFALMYNAERDTLVPYPEWKVGVSLAGEAEYFADALNLAEHETVNQWMMAPFASPELVHIPQKQLMRLSHPKNRSVQ